MMQGILHTIDGTSEDALTASEWLNRLADNALQAALVIGGAIVVLLLGRLLIRVLTRSIVSGRPLSRAARKAFAPLADASRDPQSARLSDLRRAQRARTIRSVLDSTLAAVVLAVSAVMLLDVAGLPVAPLLASAGIVGVALGFGAQSLVKDVIAGMFMLVEDQLGVGDVVDLGEATGTVEDVGLRVTRLRSLDGTVWFVPNGNIQRVGNLTKVFSRAVIEVRLDYATDVEQARLAILEAVEAARASDPAVRAAIIGEPEVPGVEALDYDAVLMRLIVPVAPSTQWTVMRAVRAHVREAFGARDVRLAVPDHTLYLDSSHPAARGASGGEDTSTAQQRSLASAARGATPASGARSSTRSKKATS